MVGHEEKIEALPIQMLVFGVPSISTRQPREHLNSHSFFLFHRIMSNLDSFPSGSWTLFFHDPEDSNWMESSYKVIGTFRTFSDLWATLRCIGTSKLLSGMFFLMKDPHPPLWENRLNVYGGSYCIKVPEKSAAETFDRYMVGAILGQTQTSIGNQIVGVSISPKKGFHIIKIWNTNAKAHHKTSDILILGDGMTASDIIYRQNTDQKM